MFERSRYRAKFPFSLGHNLGSPGGLHGENALSDGVAQQTGVSKYSYTDNPIAAACLEKIYHYPSIILLAVQDSIKLDER